MTSGTGREEDRTLLKTAHPVNSSAMPSMARRMAWAVLILYALVLLTLTHIPKPRGVFEGQNDKTLHLLAYLALGSFAYVSAALQFPTRRGLALWIVILGAVFAALDESTQPIFHRHADLFDFRSDMLGLIVAVCAMAVMRHVLRRLRAA